MSIRVLSPGLYTTIQDLGRIGWRHAGITAGGAMDSYALRVANLLVGNREGAAALELTLAGAKLAAECDLLIAVCGAYMAPHTGDGAEMPMWRPVLLKRGAVLSLGRAAIGCRAYIAVAGGITVPQVMGSRSTDARAGLGGAGGRPLAAGDTIPCGEAGDLPPLAAALAAALSARARVEGRRDWAAPLWFAPPRAYGGAGADGIVLRAMPGAESGQFSEAARAAFYREPFRAAPASDRMGCRLTGPMLERVSREELLSHGVAPGAVQVPPGGNPIILGADCQTTGGYPKIAHVAHADLPLLAQVKPGDYVRFRRITVAEAQRLDQEREAELRLLAAGLKGKMIGV
ncbi:biotin-dependent carboxyltransferase family protein [Paenibacillus tarimensis]